VLAQLDKVPGVARSYANHTGNMVRVFVAAAGDPDKVAGQVEKILATEKRHPARLKGDEFMQALDQEQWREGERVSELSAIEFRTLGMRRVKSFAEAEKLDNETTQKLVKIAEEEWDRLAKASAAGDQKQPGNIDWTDRCQQFGAAVVERATSMLTTEQVERLKESCMRASGGARPKEVKK
jgi:hypothetical protein